MNVLSNLDFLSVGITIATIGILGFVVFFQNKRSSTNQSFLIFSILTIFYGLTNYLSYQVSNDLLALWLTRVVIFFAVWHAFAFFQLAYVFPNENFIFSKLYKRVLVSFVMVVSLLNLTSLAFPKLSKFSASEHIVVTARGPALLLFALTSLILVISGIFLLAKKTRRAEGIQRTQFLLISTGAAITFSCIIIFNLILPAGFNMVKFVPLAGVFFFPYVLLTFYAIIRYKFLNVKVIATEVLTLILAIATLLDTVSSSDYLTMSLRASVFLLVLAIGILLIKSVIKEVKQREELEILDKELAAANEKLKSLDQARAEFITIASHQLRTPPATVKWYLSSILSGDYGKLTKKITEQIKKTQNTNNHLISLIEDMLNVSRIERGKMEFLFEETNVEELAHFAYEQLIPMATDKNLKLTYLPPKTALPKIMADKEKLKQVMNNLIDNAIKYTKIGTVAVTLEKVGDDIKFSVKDSGKGISQTDSQAIFQKYSRGKESIKQSAGLGLGLYVAKIIIEQHKGKIWAESEGEGKGSSFIFSVPIKSGLKQTTLVDLAAAASAHK